MYWAPFQNADVVIQIHTCTAILAILVGPLAIYRSRRDRLHRVLGYAWVAAMASAIATSFFINGFALIGPFGPIHVLSVLATISLCTGVAHILAGRIRAHEREMRSLYWTGLMVAGAFSFLPGRVVNLMLFPENENLGYVVVMLVLAGVATRSAYLRRHRQQHRTV